MATITLTPTNYYKVWWWDTASFEAISSDNLMISDSVYPVLQFPGTAGLTSASISKIALTLKKGVTGSAYTVDIGMGISNTNTVSSFPSGGSKTISNNGTAVWTLSAFPSSANPALPWNLMLSPLSHSGDTFMYFSFVSLVVTYTPPYTACGAPTSVTVSKTDVLPSTNVTLKWSGAKAGTSNAINGYNIYRSTAAGSGYTLLTSVALTTTSGSLTVTSHATVGSSYYYKIVTKGAAGSSYYSGQSSVYATLKTTVSACGPPTTVSVSTNNVRPDTEVTLTWSGATGGTNNSINGYDIYRSTAAESGYTLFTSIVSTSATGSALIVAPAIKGMAYYYKIVTKGTAGASYISGISSAYATLNAAPYGNTVKCYHNGSFVKCEMYYCNGSTFVECIPYYLHGGAWVECNAG